MTYDEGSRLLTNALKGFHGKFKKMYGQMALRLDDNSYLTTGGNKALSDITEDYYEACNIKTGDLGEIFRNRKDVNAIIFGCSYDTVQATESDSDIAVSLEDTAMIAGSHLKIIPDASPANILEAIKGSGVCLIKGIGALAACSNLKKAVAAIQIVEKECEAQNHGTLLGGCKALNPSIATSIREGFVSDYTERNEAESVPFIGFDEEEFALRNQLIEHGKDLVRKDLSYGSWGNLSVKLNDDEMLITPSSMDYFEIKIEDIVKVNIHTLEYGDQRMPSSEAPMHAMIYRRFSDASSVIHTHSNGISVFAACEAGFAIEEPSLKELIGDICLTRYEDAGSNALANSVCETLQKTHACVIPHHGAVFYGPSLDVVFAVAEAVEMRARKLLNFD